MSRFSRIALTALIAAGFALPALADGTQAVSQSPTRTTTATPATKTTSGAPVTVKPLHAPAKAN